MSAATLTPGPEPVRASPVGSRPGIGALRRRFASARAALLASLALAWLNFLLTSRWAAVPGALHGWRRPYFLAALIVTSLLALSLRLAPRPVGRLLPRITLAAAVAILVVAFDSWFPFGLWRQIPFLDNWPPRLQSTVEAIGLLRRGAFGGWQWAFLGGYHTASDITQNLGVLAFVPISLLGPAAGFHLLHAVLFAAIPLLVFLDLEHEDRDVAWLAAGVCCLLVATFSYTFIRSGDTNSVAGIACATLALVGSHAARRARGWGLPVLLAGLVLAAYSHVGFFAYAVGYLLLEALYYRDRRSAAYAVVAAAIAVVAALPMTWELWRYPAYFISNNLTPGPLPAFGFLGTARKIYYNLELLALPGRWSNDYAGLTLVFAPVLVFVAFGRRSRAGFHGVAAIATVLLIRLNLPQFGYLFIRPMHLFAVFTAAPLAYFVVHHVGRRAVAAAVLVLAGLYLQITFQPVPHVRGVSDFNAALVDHIRQLDGHLVLIENSPHRSMNGAGGSGTEPTPFPAHFESLLPGATGRRFYAGYWDGWQWSPWRIHLMAGGTFQGKPVADTSPAAFAAEMRRWGVRHLLVWSRDAHAYLGASERFVPRWSAGRWTEYEFLDADPRAVRVASGRGELKDVDWLGARVELSDVRAGDEVVVRTNFYPVWTAASGGRAVSVFSEGGQLAFRAPRSGSYPVMLVYPRRGWLSVLTLSFAAIGAVALVVAGRRSTRPTTNDRPHQRPTTDD